MENETLLYLAKQRGINKKDSCFGTSDGENEGGEESSFGTSDGENEGGAGRIETLELVRIG